MDHGMFAQVQGPGATATVEKQNGSIAPKTPPPPQSPRRPFGRFLPKQHVLTVRVHRLCRVPPLNRTPEIQPLSPLLSSFTHSHTQGRRNPIFVKCFLWAGPIPGTLVGSTSFHPNCAVRQRVVSYQLADVAGGENDPPDLTQHACVRAELALSWCGSHHS